MHASFSDARAHAICRSGRRQASERSFARPELRPAGLRLLQAVGKFSSCRGEGASMSAPLTCDSPQDAPDLCSSLMQCGYYSDSTIEIRRSRLSGASPLSAHDGNRSQCLGRVASLFAPRPAIGLRGPGACRFVTFRQHGQVRLVFQAELDIAATGRLYAAEWLRLLQIYDRPEFRQIYGVRPGQLTVQPAMRMLDQSSQSALDLVVGVGKNSRTRARFKAS